MRATSAFHDFIPKISLRFEDLGTCHSARTPHRQCPGCRIGAEAIFQDLMRSWEWFLIELLTDLILGHHTAHVTHPQRVSTSRYPNRTAAHNALLRTKYIQQTGRVSLYPQPRSFLLLHNPSMITAVADYWIPDNPISIEILNSQADLSDLIVIRHGLSHGTLHAQNEMRAVMLRLDPLNHYGTVGEFLLSRPSLSSPKWLDHFIDTICRIVSRISP